jgi:hypothetical protein
MTSRRIQHTDAGYDGGDEHIRSGCRCESRKMMSANEGLILGFLVSALCHTTKCGHWPDTRLCNKKKSTNLTADSVHRQ